MRLSRGFRRSNGGVLAVLVVLVVLLPLLVSSAFVQHGHEGASRDRALEFQARQQAGNVADYFARARSLTQILATNPSFAAFYESPGRRLDKIRGNSPRGPAGERGARVPRNPLPRQHRRGLLHRRGRRRGRAGGQREDRAAREPLARRDGRGVLPATFDLRPGQVYQSRPYVSPDTNEWVIANSAPVALPGRPTPAIVHLAEAVAARLGLSSEQTVEVKRAASLHDIGKLAIPESILGKRGPLTADEWEFIRQHTIIGERILAAAPSLSRCGKFVRASHEAWDGTGYPDRLAGETIPIESRVIAVCDAYHAMTTPRPYASSRTGAEALAELQRCAGNQFDPRVVRALVAELASDSSESARAISS